MPIIFAMCFGYNCFLIRHGTPENKNSGNQEYACHCDYQLRFLHMLKFGMQSYRNRHNKLPKKGNCPSGLRFGLFAIFAGTFIWLYFLKLLHFCNEFFRWFERRNVMLRNMHSDILFYITPNLRGAFLRDKTTEATDINIFTASKGVFHFFEHSFQRNKDIHFWNSCLFRYLINEIGFSHCYRGLMVSYCQFITK